MHDSGISFDIGRHERCTRGHRLQEHDAHTFAANGRRTEDVGAGEIARFVHLRNETGEDHIAPAVALDKLLEAVV
jgi:hypothetical protein